MGGEGAGPLEGHLCAAAGVALQADVLAAGTAALGGLRGKGAGRSSGEAASGLSEHTWLVGARLKLYVTYLTFLHVWPAFTW